MLRKIRTRALIGLMLVLQLALPFLNPSTTAALGAGDAYFTEMANRYYSGIYLRDCFIQTGRNEVIAPDNLITWLNEPTKQYTVKVGRYLQPVDGVAKCTDSALLGAALSHLGYANGAALLTTLGFKQESRTVKVKKDPLCSSYCTLVDQTVTAYVLSGPANIDAAFNDKIGGPLSPTARFYVYDKIFADNCSLVTDGSGKTQATLTQVIEEPAGSGKFTTKDTPVSFTVKTQSTPRYSGGPTATTETDTANNNILAYDYNGQDITCKALLDRLNGYAPIVAKFNNDNPTKAILSGSSTTGAGADTQGTELACSGGALGWVLCPLTKLVGDAITGFAEVIGAYMVFSPLLGSDEGSAIYSVWSLVVGIANLLLVLAFLIVIFSQATSVGLSAYGIKKMLPRIIAAAILINLSYYICALMVDVTNVLGGGVANMVKSAMSAIPNEGGASRIAADADYGQAAIGLVAAATAVTTLAVTGTIAFILPILLTGAVAIGFLFIVLTLRHIVAVLLIMISPLAFAAMILPGTEGWFKKWYKALFMALILYPIIMLLAYGSMLVSKVILLTAPADPVNLKDWITVIVAFIALFAWIFAIKFIVTWGAGLVGKIAGMVNDKNKGLIDRSRNWAKGKQQRSTFSQWQQKRKSAGDEAAARRSYNRLGRHSTLAGVGMGRDARQIMSSQISDANDKIHAQAVGYAKQKVSQSFNPSDKTQRLTWAKTAADAAKRGDQVTFDAIMSRAADVGADEYSHVYTQVQGHLRAAGGADALKEGGAYHDIVRDSNLYVAAHNGADLAPKNRALTTALQTGSPDDDIASKWMVNDAGIRTYYTKMSAEKVANFSSDTAKSAAQFIDTNILEQVVNDPVLKGKVGTTAFQAYEKELADRYSGAVTQVPPLPTTVGGVTSLQPARDIVNYT